MTSTMRTRSRWRFTDRSVYTKMLTSLVVVALVAVVLNVLALSRMATLNENLTQVNTRHVTGLDLLNDVRGGLTDSYFSMMALLAQGNEQSQLIKNIKDSEQRASQAMTAYEDNALHTPERDAAVKLFNDNVAQYRALRDVLMFGEQPAAGFTMPPTDQTTAVFTTSQATMMKSVDDLQQIEKAETTALTSTAAEDYAHARRQMIVVLIVGLVLALALALFRRRPDPAFVASGV